MKPIAAFACALAFLPLAARAGTNDGNSGQPPAAKLAEEKPAVAKGEDRVTALEERVRQLEAELAAIKNLLLETRAAPAEPNQPGGGKLITAAARSTTGDPVPAASVAAPAGAQQGGTTQLPNYGGATSLAKALNPDISVIGDFLGAVGHNPVRSVPALEMHETEVGLQAIVDPYARGDVFISFGETGVNVEEAYLTFTALPGGFVAKVGKMRADFGQVNKIHNHALPWTDRPLVTENLVAGEDGINDAGLSISRILPAPKGFFLEATGQVYRGDAGRTSDTTSDLFFSSRRNDVTGVARLHGYKDLSESTNLDMGFSFARGHNDAGSAFHTTLYGVDATLRWKPLRRAIYHNFLARTELIWSQREQLGLLETPETQHAFGFYASGEYRATRRWTIGGRYDRSGRARNANMIDSGVSGILTYWPSEFSQIRAQYRFARYAEQRDANELRFQFLFVLGAHGAHPF